jgi:hypothetical protein
VQKQNRSQDTAPARQSRCVHAEADTTRTSVMEIYTAWYKKWLMVVQEDEGNFVRTLTAIMYRLNRFELELVRAYSVENLVEGDRYVRVCVSKLNLSSRWSSSISRSKLTCVMSDLVGDSRYICLSSPSSRHDPLQKQRGPQRSQDASTLFNR